MLLSVLLQAAAAGVVVSKLGAAIGAGLAVIGAGVGIGKIGGSLLEVLGPPPGGARGIAIDMCFAPGLVVGVCFVGGGVVFFGFIFCLISVFICLLISFFSSFGS